jgi:hypothetical protein
MENPLTVHHPRLHFALHSELLLFINRNLVQLPVLTSGQFSSTGRSSNAPQLTSSMTSSQIIVRHSEMVMSPVFSSQSIQGK